jgi:hypothetical protein
MAPSSGREFTNKYGTTGNRFVWDFRCNLRLALDELNKV